MSDYTATGAGTSAVNGTFVSQGLDGNGNEYWKNGSEYLQWVTFDSTYGIGHGFPVSFSNYDYWAGIFAGTLGDPTAGTWNNQSGFWAGTNPAPTIAIVDDLPDPTLDSDPIINSAGDTITINFNALTGAMSGTTGFSLSGLTHSACTIGTYTWATDVQLTAPLSRVITSDETPVIEYSAISGDIIDTGSTAPLAVINDGAITNNSTQTYVEAASGLVALAINKGVKLSWTQNGATDPVNIYRGTVTGEESETAIATSITGTTYTDTGLTNTTEYFYTIKSNHSSALSAVTSEVNATPEAYGIYQ